MRALKTAQHSLSKSRVNNPMGIDPGFYNMVIAGWKWTIDSNNITNENVGLIVKCSGWNSFGEARPRMEQYGKNRNWSDDGKGCQPYKIDFPIMSNDYHKGLRDLNARVRWAWERGYKVVFHCNRGEIRSPLAAAVFMQYASGIEAKWWLTTQIMPARRLGDIFQKWQHQCATGNTRTWCPSNYHNFVTIRRLRIRA